jgi:hypothetical protein
LLALLWPPAAVELVDLVVPPAWLPPGRELPVWPATLLLLVATEVPPAAVELALELELEPVDPAPPLAGDDALVVPPTPPGDEPSEQASPSEPSRKRQGPMICDGRVCIVFSPAEWRSKVAAQSQWFSQ